MPIPSKSRADYRRPKGAPAGALGVGRTVSAAGRDGGRGGRTERLRKKIAQVEAELRKAQEKLANPAFAQKAPAAVLEEHKQRVAAWQAQLEKLREDLAR